MTKSYCDAYNAGFEKGYTKAKNELERRVLIDSDGNIQPLDTHQERKKGRWIDDGKGLYMCSSCGKPWVHWWARVVPLDQMRKELRYCPKCGADMRGDAK